LKKTALTRRHPKGSSHRADHPNHSETTM
jgi:hypothetical protein